MYNVESLVKLILSSPVPVAARSRRRSVAACLLRLWVWIPRGA